MALREECVNGWTIRIVSRPGELRCTITRDEESPKHGSEPMALGPEDDRQHIADMMLESARYYVVEHLTPEGRFSAGHLA